MLSDETPEVTREKILDAIVAYELETVRLEAEILKLREAIAQARIAMGQSENFYRDAYGIAHHSAPAMLSDDVDDLAPKDEPAPYLPVLPMGNPVVILLLIGAILTVSVLAVILPRLFS